MKQERRQNGRCNRVVRLKKPDGLSEARDFSHGFFTLVSADVLQAIYSELEEDMGIEVKAYFLEMIGKESSINASKEEKWTL